MAMTPDDYQEIVLKRIVRENNPAMRIMNPVSISEAEEILREKFGYDMKESNSSNTENVVIQACTRCGRSLVLPPHGRPIEIRDSKFMHHTCYELWKIENRLEAEKLWGRI